MHNRDTESAWHYHNLTKHSWESVRKSTHFLDWDNQPLPFKIYPELPVVALPQETGETGMPALQALVEQAPASGERIPALRELSHLLYHSAGITKRRGYPGGEILFRAAACTGALYEIELYLVCDALPGLAAGVYHFNPRDQALDLLREGEYRDLLARATGQERHVAHAPAVVISTGTYWRNAWKYQARTYRHFGWDNGTILANLLAAAAALGLPARLTCGFVDSEINDLLGLDTDREVALSLAALGRTESLPPEAPLIWPLQYKIVRLSRAEVDYPAMREMHWASSLFTPEEVAAWRVEQESWPQKTVQPPPTGTVEALAPLRGEQIPRDTIEQVVLRRGSSRRFEREPISLAQLSTILERSSRGVAADFVAPYGAALNDMYLIVHEVEGVLPGAYFYNVEKARLECLKTGDFRKHAVFLALDQDLAGDAAAAVFFLTDLEQCLARLGNRAYRAVQLEAGILGGRLYLGAYAQRLGATGLTFYDDDVVKFFSPHAAGKSAIFLVAVGHSARR